MKIQSAVLAAAALMVPLAVQAQDGPRPAGPNGPRPPPLNGPPTPPTGSPAKQIDFIHNILDVAIDSGQIPGAVVLVAEEGKIVHFEVQGVESFGSKKPLQKDSIFGVASFSKPITAVAVMMLVDEGKINVNDPVSKYIPEFGVNRMVRVLKPGSPPAPFTALPFVQPPSTEFGVPQYDMVPAAREMTVRDLLTHTSGIQIYGVSNDTMPNPKPGEKLSDVIPKMGKATLEFQPGSRWAYSNGQGFEVLGRIVEIASGQPYDQFLSQRLFTPLKMKDTAFGVRADAVGRAVGVFPGAPPQMVDKTTYFSGAAGLWSTVEDYSHFAQMLANGGEYEGHKILKPETVKAMSSNQIGPLLAGGYPPMGMPLEGVKFGYGVLTLTNPAAAGTRLPVGSFGWDGVGTRRFWALPVKHTVIVSMVPLVGPAAAPFQRLVEATVVTSLTAK